MRLQALGVWCNYHGGVCVCVCVCFRGRGEEIENMKEAASGTDPRSWITAFFSGQEDKV